MAEPWIRVHAALADKRIVLRASAALGVSVNETIGLLVRFWGAMSRLGNDGHVDILDDHEIETWAGWRRKRGEFAAFIRSKHTDDEGRVNEWDEYNGALEERRAKDRDRQQRRRDLRKTSRGLSTARHADDQRDVRGTSTGGHAERQRDVRDSSAPARAVRNETIRNSTTRSKTTTSREPAAGGLNGDEKPPRETPRATWLSPICAVWELRAGAGSFASIDGQAAKVLAPLVKGGHAPEVIATHLEVYLERTDPQFRSITKFAQSFAEWAPSSNGTAPIVRDGWLTPEGEKLTRPAGVAP